MAKQRYNVGINSLSYAPSETPYVAPPTKEILDFRKERETDYLTTKNNINLEQELKKTIKSIPHSKGIYDELVANVDATLAGITPDNYADKTLDSEQLIHDTKNKFGGKELNDQYNDYQAKAKVIAETKNVRPEKLEWYDKQLSNNLKGITRDEKGNFVVPGLDTPTLVPEQDLFKNAQNVVKDFKSSGAYTHHSDGRITIDKGILGRYGITKTEFINEKEVYDTVLNILGKDGTNREYLESEAEFSVYKKPPTVESVTQSLRALPDETLAVLFPEKKPENITTEDITSLTGDNPQALKELAKQAFTINYMDSVGQSMANVYGFKKEDKTYFEDPEYMAAVNAKWATKAKGLLTGIDGEETGPMVIVKPSNTYTIASPIIYDNYKADEEKNIVTYVNAKKNYDTYVLDDNRLAKSTNPVDINERIRLKERILEAKEELQRADAAIQYSRQAQTNLTNSTIKVAKDKGVDAEQDYKAVLPTIIQAVDRQNSSNLVSTGYSVDVSSIIKPNSYNDKTKTLKIDLPKFGEKTLKIYTKEQAKNNEAAKETEYIIKDNAGYKLYSNTADRAQVPIKTVFNNAITANYKVDQLSNNPYNRTDGLSKSKLVKVPTVDEYNTLVSKLFMNPNSKVDEAETIVKEYASKTADKIRKTNVKPSDINVNQTFDYLYVDDNVKKGTAAYDLLKLGKSIDETLISEANQYKVVNNEGQWEDLPLYLKSKGLTVNDIDFTKSKSSVALTSDREFGQKINMPLHLTEEGKKALLKKDPNALDLSGTLNLTAVNYTGKNSGFNKRLVDTVYAAYKESFSNNLPSGDQERKAYGLIAFDNSQYSKDFYDLNLYTLADGERASYTTPTGQDLVINAIKRSARQSKLGDNDFYLTNKNEDIMAYNKQTGTSGFIPKAEYAADRGGIKYKRTMFASPEDVASLIGQNFLNLQTRNTNSPVLQRTQIKTQGSSYEVGQDRVISTTHKASTNTIIKTYGKTSAPRILRDSKGKEVSINSRINPKELTYLKDILPDNISEEVSYPYINNNNVTALKSIVKDYNLQLTSLFRSEDLNKKLPSSAEDSLHQYGKSLDAHYDKDSQKLLNDLTSNPQMAENLGISYAFKHIIKGVPHLHIDFK